MSRIAYIVFFALLLTPCISDAKTIDVQIKGVDDGAKTTKQRDYKEAVLFAKREAIERAGVKIKSMTTVKDLVVNSDYIESQAEAVLLPGYNILDMGYSADGTYQIVLVGKVKIVSEGIDSKELRYAKSLMDRGEKSQAERIITDIIENSKDDNAVAEAMYYLILWNFTSNEKDSYDRLKAYYPNSKYVSRVETFFAERKAKRRRIESEKEAKRRRIEAEKEAKRRRIESEKETKRRRIEAKKEAKKIEYLASFIDRGNGIVLDRKTGLEWIAGPDRNITWDEAVFWVNNLTVAGGGWRMPTRKELKTIFHDHAGTRCLTPLLKTTGYWVWSTDDCGSGSHKCLELEYNYAHFVCWNNGRSWASRGFAVRSRR